MFQKCYGTGRLLDETWRYILTDSEFKINLDIEFRFNGRKYEYDYSTLLYTIAKEYNQRNLPIIRNLAFAIVNIFMTEPKGIEGAFQELNDDPYNDWKSIFPDWPVPTAEVRKTVDKILVLK